MARVKRAREESVREVGMLLMIEETQSKTYIYQKRMIRLRKMRRI